MKVSGEPTVMNLAGLGVIIRYADWFPAIEVTKV